ncbi:MAG TPA: NAD-dependent epimerase/dehydratase family protein [Alphaproteobacteria bacterium]|nr:NAD-dependent epimerase/dehydratase family protein [Alphaproteobacteria bacterium]
MPSKKFKVLILGSTGMVGSEVLAECIKDDRIKSITVVDRVPTPNPNKKVKQIIHQNFNDFSKIKKQIIGHDVCFYCIGVYQGSVPKEKFIEITYEYFTKLAHTIESKKTTFCLFSAGGADSKSNILFAKWKGECEDYLLKLNFKDIYILRPGYIHPSNPAKLHKSLNYYIFEALYPIVKFLSTNLSTTSNQLARAMVSVSLNGFDKKILSNSDIRKF